MTVHQARNEGKQMNYGTVQWTDPTGEIHQIDVDSLATTTASANIMMPNLHWDNDTGLLLHLAAADVLHMAEDGKLYRSTNSQSPSVAPAATMCVGPYPCARPHPHPQPGQG